MLCRELFRLRSIRSIITIPPLLRLKSNQSSLILSQFVFKCIFLWNTRFNASGFQHEIYPLELTDPNHLSTLDTKDPHPLPPTASSSKLLEAAITQIKSIANSTVFNGSCAKCLAGLEVAKFLALAAPEQGPTFAVQVCELFDFANPCNATYGEDVLGSVVKCPSSADFMMCSTSCIGNTNLRE